MAKCLVLGANGFLGSHLVDSLLASGHSVRAFDGFRTGTKQNLLVKQENLEVCKGNFFNREDLRKALDNIDYVFHFISTTNPATSSKDPLFDVETNLKYSIELLKLCVSEKVKRVIFPSTGGAIYGRTADKPFNEDDVAEPKSPYAIGKQAIEGYLRYFKFKHGLDYITIRISNPYGERQNVTGAQGVIPIFLNKLKNDEPIAVFGDGSMVRDYVYVTDVTKMIVTMFDKDHKYDVYNLGSSHATSVSELINAMEKISNKKFVINYQPMRPIDVQTAVINVDRLIKEFRCVPTIDLESGIEKTWRYVISKT